MIEVLMIRVLRSVVKWVKRILMGLANVDLLIEVCFNEEMKRVLFEKKV